MREILSGERLSVVNLVRLLEAGTPMTLVAVLVLVYGSKLGKNDLSFSIMWPSS